MPLPKGAHPCSEARTGSGGEGKESDRRLVSVKTIAIAEEGEE